MSKTVSPFVFILFLPILSLSQENIIQYRLAVNDKVDKELLIKDTQAKLNRITARLSRKLNIQFYCKLIEAQALPCKHGLESVLIINHFNLRTGLDETWYQCNICKHKWRK